jgi:hypothetical protein
MDEKKRSRLSPTQKTDIWRRWKAGQSLHEIGRAYGKPNPFIRCVLLPGGGIAPAARCPGYFDVRLQPVTIESRSPD